MIPIRKNLRCLMSMNLGEFNGPRRRTPNQVNNIRQLLKNE